MLTFFHLLSFWKHGFTYETFEKPISWPLLQILPSLSLHSKFPVLLLPSSHLLSSYFSVFSSSFLLLLFSLSLSATLNFPALVFTTYHTSLDTLSSSPLLFSSWFQDCGKLAITFPKLYSTSVLQSYWSLFFLHAPSNKYLPLLYA